MAVSQLSHRLRRKSRHRLVRPRLATFLLVAIVLLMGGISVAWFAGEGTISAIFHQLDWLQKNPPAWVTVPMVAGQYLLVPSVALLLGALTVMQLSPEPRPWSRAVVVGSLLVLTLRYLLWRSLNTLNLADPLNGVFSLGLLLLELLMLTSGMIQLFLMLRVRDRRQEADASAIAVVEARFTPSVDILIPTYDEPEFILRRTVIGCQALEYSNKRIYLLDDTHRPEVCLLAQALGCEYVTRPNNRYAKAGNLNHAIFGLRGVTKGQAQGELLVVFDADFVPTRDFLTRTVGFFQDSQIALVQTPQSFYNPDPIARNLGLENILTPEEEVFYRQIQPIRDGAGSVICSGTSFIVRRAALEEIGGFVTDSLSEDYFTGIRISAKGHQLVYLDEKLSAGLAADNMAAHATQRLRWARGTLQAFFIQANPLTIPGLSPIQRLAHLEGLLYWFTSISRVGYLLIPLAYSFLGVTPVQTGLNEVLFFFIPYYVLQLAVFSWLNHHARSALLSDIYSLVLAVPLAATVIQAMLSPFSKNFKVTPKGTVSDRFNFNWGLALPLLVLFGLTAISLWRNLGLCLIACWEQHHLANAASHSTGASLGWIWSTYNLMMLGIALLILLDVPKPDVNDWFDLRRTVQLRIQPEVQDLAIAQAANAFPRQQPTPAVQPVNLTQLTFWGVTTMLSEGGAEVALTQPGFPALGQAETIPVTLEILEANLKLSGTAIRTGMEAEFPTVRIKFEALTLAQQRSLVEMLFCRPGQWQRRRSPSEWQSLLLLFRILLKPRVLFDREADVRAMTVAKV